MRQAAGPARAHARRQDIEVFVERHGVTLLAVARRFCASATDAEDAYQRGLEILLTKAPDDVSTWLPWSITVVRNEALKSHRRVSSEPFDPVEDSHEGRLPGPADSLVIAESVGSRLEALSRIKPEQLRCLLLRAEGLTYSDIERTTGFSRTQIGRFLCDGRKALSSHLGRVESGAECMRVHDAISALADGEATLKQQVDARRHLFACARCRALMRDFRGAPQHVAGLLPLAPALGAASGRSEWIEPAARAVEQPVTTLTRWMQGMGEAAFAKKAAAVTIVAATVAAGGSQIGSVRGPAQPDAVPEVVAAPPAAELEIPPLPGDPGPEPDDGLDIGPAAPLPSELILGGAASDRSNTETSAAGDDRRAALETAPVDEPVLGADPGGDSAYVPLPGTELAP